MRRHWKRWSLSFLALFLASCGDFVLYDLYREPLEIQPSSISLYSDQSHDFTAKGGAKGYHFAIVSGGGSIDPASGAFTPPDIASDVVIEVVDGTGKSAQATAHVLGFRPLVITPAATTILMGTTCVLGHSGGKAPYSYMVSTGTGSVNAATGLFTAPLAGEDDWITLTDGNGDMALALVSILEPQALLVIPATTTLMQGASLQFAAAGGTSPYSFTKQSGAGSVTAGGLYTAPGGAGSAVIRVTDSVGSTSDASVTIVASGPLGLSATATSVEEGKTATFSAYGGTPGYTYSLSVSASGGSINAVTGLYGAGGNVGAGIDTVVVTDSTMATSSLGISVIPSAPTDLEALGSYGTPHEILLTWTDNSSSEDGFHIERKQGLGAFVLAGSVGPGITQFVDSGLTPNTGYLYRVKAFKGALESGPSNQAFDLSN
jgi:hypothetical protein